MARIAGILAAKKTSELIPLCHPITIRSVGISFDLWGCGNALAGKSGLDIEVVVKSLGKSGLEMEALTGVSIAGLTVYDMCKKVDRGMTMWCVRIVKKTGGRAGDCDEAGQHSVGNSVQSILPSQ